MTDSKSKKNQRTFDRTNIIESLKNAGTSIGGSAIDSIKEDLIKKTPGDFMDQLFGPRPRKSYSGEITVGETLEINEVFTGMHAEKQKLQKQLVFERRLKEEELGRLEKRRSELKMQLQVLQQEVIILAQTTQDLSKETQIAAMQVTAEPGVYHITVFQRLLEFLQSFRKRIEKASIWLHGVNRRAAKKNAWGVNYKKHGAKYLLSGEHYLTRSAG